MGIPFEANRFPIQLSEADLENAQLVIALKESEHRPMMQEHFPAWVDRIEYWAVDDIDCALPDDALSICESCVEELVQRLVATDRSGQKQRKHVAA